MILFISLVKSILKFCRKCQVTSRTIDEPVLFVCRPLLLTFIKFQTARSISGKNYNNKKRPPVDFPSSNILQSSRTTTCVEVIVFLLFSWSHQCIVIAQQRQPVGTVLLCHRVAALLFIDGISFCLGQTEEAADHAQVLPQGPVLWTGVLLPTQQFAQPALQEKR